MSEGLMNTGRKHTQAQVETAVLRSHLPMIWMGAALIAGSALLNLVAWLAR